jgi:hypothetical protein
MRAARVGRCRMSSSRDSNEKQVNPGNPRHGNDSNRSRAAQI